MAGRLDSTQVTYAKTAALRASQRNDPTVWLPEFEKLVGFTELDDGRVHLLDVGCGSAPTIASLCRVRGIQYTGITYTEEEIGEAQRRVKEKIQSPDTIQFLVMDMRSLGFSAKAFNCFWSSASFLHILKDDIQSVLLGIKRVMKPGGYGFIAVEETPPGQQECAMVYDAEGNGRLYIYYSLEEFRQILVECGFEVLEANRVSKPHAPGRMWLTYFVRTLTTGLA
jgi:ubiquinone/menaquinone biosynthesis C-methylase UbiE